MLTSEQIKNIDLWIEALLSGKYKQAQGVLNNLETGGMCCLGVYADAVAGVDWQRGYHNIDNRETAIGVFGEDDNQQDVMPGSLVNINTGLSTGAQVELTDMNDHGKTFAEIVEVIRLFVNDPTKHDDYVEEDHGEEDHDDKEPTHA